MTDVVQIAYERRCALEAKVGKLDDFIGMAEKLMKYSQSKPNKALDTEDEKPGKSTGPATARPYSAAADGKDAEAEREDLSVRELKAGERVRKSRTILDEPLDPRRLSPLIGPT